MRRSTCNYIQQQTTKRVEVYYERLWKLRNCLHVKATNVFLTTIFKACLLPYLILATASMKRNTSIEHKEATIVCDENGPISLSYNALVTTPKANTMVKLVVLVVTTKSTLTCTNCAKTNYSLKTCHNMKIEVVIVPTATIKFIELIAKTKTQPIKSGRIHVCYPYIIYFNVEHIFGECPKKIGV